MVTSRACPLGKKQKTKSCRLVLREIEAPRHSHTPQSHKNRWWVTQLLCKVHLWISDRAARGSLCQFSLTALKPRWHTSTVSELSVHTHTHTYTLTQHPPPPLLYPPTACEVPLYLLMGPQSPLMDKDAMLSAYQHRSTLFAFPRKRNAAPNTNAQMPSSNPPDQVMVSISTCKTRLEPWLKRLQDRWGWGCLRIYRPPMWKHRPLLIIMRHFNHLSCKYVSTLINLQEGRPLLSFAGFNAASENFSTLIRSQIQRECGFRVWAF